MQKVQVRGFSVELKSKKNLTNVTLTDGSSDAVLIEGDIGKLLEASFKENLILEVIGENGVLRIDLQESEISKPSKKKPVEAQIHG